MRKNQLTLYDKAEFILNIIENIKIQKSKQKGFLKPQAKGDNRAPIRLGTWQPTMIYHTQRDRLMVAQEIEEQNTMRMARASLGILLVALLSGCGEQTVDGRWYTQAQVERGKAVFSENCASCHGGNAQGTFNWRRPLEDGSYPPPPLNGSAHAWHHSFDMLMRTINQGGAPIGGQMPAFQDELSKDDKKATIAYFQSKWDQRIYDAWLDRGGL